MARQQELQQVQGEQEYGFQYTHKDLMLYALSIGIGSDEAVSKQELKYLYEHHPKFSPIPTFCVALSFWSNRIKDNQTSGRMPTFPPPIMADADLIPRHLIQGNVDISKNANIHIWQSIVWHTSLPLPTDLCSSVKTQITSRTLLVEPKSIGTFVTSESRIMVQDPTMATSNNFQHLCTMQSTALVLGVSKDAVTPYKSGIAKITSKPRLPDSPPTFEWTFATVPTQALLYRLASGDTNHIHVDNSAAKMMGSDSKSPLLHGLCTLGIAFRGILHLVPNADKRVQKLECQFTQPVFVGATLLIQIWKCENDTDTNATRLLFAVLDKDTGAKVVDCGYVQLGPDAPNGIQSHL